MTVLLTNPPTHFFFTTVVLLTNDINLTYLLNFYVPASRRSVLQHTAPSECRLVNKYLYLPRITVWVYFGDRYLFYGPVNETTQ